MEIFDLLDKELFMGLDGSPVTVGRLAFAALVLLGGLIGARIVSHVVRRRLGQTRLDANATNLVVRVVMVAVLVAVVLAVLALLHIPLTALAFLSGAVAIGVGFGAQTIINNLISGWILMTTRPVRIGDLVEIDGALGRVEDVGNRSTQIRRIDGVHLLVPNSFMLDRIVVNWTRVDDHVRTFVRVGVAYGSPVREVEKLLYQVVEEHQSVLDQPEPYVVFDDFGDNSLAFDVFFWCDVSAGKMLPVVRSELRFRIDELFAEAGIVIAFPQRDVHLDASRPVPVVIARDDSGS